MTEPTLRELCERVIETYESLSDEVSEWPYHKRQHTHDNAADALEHALGPLSHRAAGIILAALDAARAATAADHELALRKAYNDGYDDGLYQQERRHD